MGDPPILKQDEVPVSITDETRRYLDDAITMWREVRDGEVDIPEGLRPWPGLPDEGARALAALYIDAFQSVRVTLLGELMPA